jgi:hypothetical protein
VPHSRAPHGVHCTGVTGGSGTVVVVVVDVLVLVGAALVDEPDRADATVLVGPPARPAAGAHALKQAAASTMTTARRGG